MYDQRFNGRVQLLQVHVKVFHLVDFVLKPLNVVKKKKTVLICLKHCAFVSYRIVFVHLVGDFINRLAHLVEQSHNTGTTQRRRVNSFG